MDMHGCYSIIVYVIGSLMSMGKGVFTSRLYIQGGQGCGGSLQ